VSEFSDNLDRLASELGRSWRVELDVNQAYAQNHHQTMTWVHRHGGGPLYLAAPFMEAHVSLLQKIADKVLTHDGSDILTGMIEVSEDMSRMVLDNAPGDGDSDELRNSGHPTVERDGIVVYDRPPIAPRRPEGLPHR
jgi:hypothetical protein